MSLRSILLVEDSPGDVRLTQEAFAAANQDVQIHVANDGVDAMCFLRGNGTDVAATRPDLILLDLNMPRMDGREVLTLVKSDHDLKTIPTVILTTSTAVGDITMSYQLQANCYLAKPVHLADFEVLVRSINDFWMMRARLPRRRDEE